MTTKDETPEWDERTFLSLADLIGIGKRVSTLATAIEEHGGIQGWDRFGRFKTFKPDSKGEDAATFARVLDALAMQYEWESDGQRRQEELSPVELADYSGPFYFGWYDDEAPDFSAIVLGAAKQPVQPQKPANLAALGRQGADVKHAGTRALKAWALDKAKDMRGHPRDIARKLAGAIPAHLADVSKDPFRLINEALQKKKG